MPWPTSMLETNCKVAILEWLLNQPSCLLHGHWTSEPEEILFKRNKSISTTAHLATAHSASSKAAAICSIFYQSRRSMTSTFVSFLNATCNVGASADSSSSSESK